MRRVIAVLICAAVLLCLASCGKQESKVLSFDVNEAAEELFKRLNFDDDMVKLDSERAGELYGFGADEIAAYAGSGATPEMISVAHYSSDTYLKNASAQVYRFLDSQKEDFASYAPFEVTKIEKAAVKEEGGYIICVISADENPEAQIETVLNKYR